MEGFEGEWVQRKELSVCRWEGAVPGTQGHAGQVIPARGSSRPPAHLAAQVERVTEPRLLALLGGQRLNGLQVEVVVKMQVCGGSKGHGALGGHVAK